MSKYSKILCLIFWAFTVLAHAADLKCDLCGKIITGTYYKAEDAATGEKKILCPDCEKLPDRCFYCRLPIKTSAETLPDTRELCDRDAKLAVQTEDEGKALCDQVRYDLDRLLSRFMTYPSTNIILSIVNRFYLENLMHSPTAGQVCVSLFGVTCSNPMPGNRMVHTVSILSHLPKERLMAVCAHEYTHAWMGENVSRERTMALDKDTLEAFCELVAYKYMQSQQMTRQMDIIKENNYTKGKILVLIAADEQYGFGSVVDWIKSGDDATFEMDSLQRVRAINGTYVPTKTVAPMALLAVPPSIPTPVPNTLVLKGISGAGTHRFALINNATLETMERAKVRVGQTNLAVRCLAISDKSVTIQVEGTGEKKELFLRDSQ